MSGESGEGVWSAEWKQVVGNWLSPVVSLFSYHWGTPLIDMPYRFLSWSDLISHTGWASSKSQPCLGQTNNVRNLFKLAIVSAKLSCGGLSLLAAKYPNDLTLLWPWRNFGGCVTVYFSADEVTWGKRVRHQVMPQGYVISLHGCVPSDGSAHPVCTTGWPRLTRNLATHIQSQLISRSKPYRLRNGIRHCLIFITVYVYREKETSSYQFHWLITSGSDLIHLPAEFTLESQICVCANQCSVLHGTVVQNCSLGHAIIGHKDSRQGKSSKGPFLFYFFLPFQSYLPQCFKYCN